jgi:putative glutamine amidotransferase
MRKKEETSDVHNTPEPGWIAVVGQLRKDHGRIPTAYLDAVAGAGGRPGVLSTFHLLPDEEIEQRYKVVAGIDEEDVTVLDGAAGLLLPGGGDIDPAWYGSKPHPKTTRVSHRRDRFEINLLRIALEHDMPILAICHGMQLLNVYLGGTLEQHLADEPNRLAHDVGLPDPQPIHRLRIRESSLLARIFQTTEGAVNSHHHQGVGRLASGLEEVAWAEDGVLEAFVHPAYSWVVGVQWHPEAMAPVDELQARLFRSFVGEARRYAPLALGERAPA